MHQQTPWTKKGSSLPSDRIRSPAPPTPKNAAKGKRKAEPEPELPKSKAVRALEGLRNALRAAGEAGMEKDPKGGCFCQARMHALSSHAPLCRACGLVLCMLNSPAHTCPSCAEPLLAAPQRTALLERLDAQIAELLAHEAAERARKAEEARRAVGAFPTLAAGPTVQQQQQPQPQTRTVLSLNSKTKRVTVSAFTSTPASSARSSPAPTRPVTPEEERAGPPPATVPFAPAALLDVRRPWRDLGDGGAVYVPAPALDGEAEVKKKSRSRKAKGKAKENDAVDEGSAPTILD
ncbi:hypothetical protein B0H15DRAFT_908607 [Mycena belliarum]|uniref:TRIP4/RQT4 C2HC5-type zinc finger domain-containing protein n=1 Tax=Mycena belliarum TaxID=1033014 RepID=A0AAD6XQY7_9AGAR|nr:hypothetical protein B0H15DRAFT_908607 [Mycena belliae]